MVARGSGTGLSGGALPRADGIVVAFDRMTAILEIDTDNHAAVVQPGVTLEQLDAALAPLGLIYPVFPGESSASLGGNVGTNAGGMRAIRYGVTRHHVLGLEAVLATGEVHPDRRQVREVLHRLRPHPAADRLRGDPGPGHRGHLEAPPAPGPRATVLAPFGTLDEVTRAVPRIVASGVGPLILEYLDLLTMAAITASAGLDLGVPESVRDAAARLPGGRAREHPRGPPRRRRRGAGRPAGGAWGPSTSTCCPPSAGADLIGAREKAFFVAKAAGADDIIDAVVPRAAIADYLATVGTWPTITAPSSTGCGHVGDGNVHLSVFQPDAARRSALLRAIFAAAVEVGGAVSGEHGIGTEKQAYFLDLEDPVKVELMRRIKAAFDPHAILGPARLFDEKAGAGDARATRNAT